MGIQRQGLFDPPAEFVLLPRENSDSNGKISAAHRDTDAACLLRSTYSRKCRSVFHSA